MRVATMASQVGRITAARTAQQGARGFAAMALRNRTLTARQEPVAFRRGYHDKVLDHYNSPRNVGTLPKADQDVGIGLVGAPACGDVLKLSIRVDDQGRISECKFKTFGCGSAIASSSYVTELIKGLTLEEAAKIKNNVIAKELSLPPVKLHCSMLAQDAVAAALRDYYRKNPNVKGSSFEVGVDKNKVNSMEEDLQALAA